MPELEMPSAIRTFVDATNAGDSAAFESAFADDAWMNDWGRVFTGRDGIASWNRTDNIGVQAHFDVHGISDAGGTTGTGDGAYTLRVTVSGNGFNGPGSFAFVVRDGLIASFVIS